MTRVSRSDRMRCMIQTEARLFVVDHFCVTPVFELRVGMLLLTFTFHMHFIEGTFKRAMARLKKNIHTIYASLT